MSCKHEHFNASVKVNRFEDKPDIFSADICICCANCAQPMQFIGMPTGLLWDQPTTNMQGTEARMPIQPYRQPKWARDIDSHLEKN